MKKQMQIFVCPPLILMYEIVTDKIPYSEYKDGKMSYFAFAQKVVNENYRPNCNNELKKSIKKLIERCWS